MLMLRAIVGILFLMSVVPASAALPAVLQFKGDRSLSASVRGKPQISALVGASASQVKWITGHNKTGEGIRLPASGKLRIPLDAFSGDEGTLMLWFRPDWSACDFTFHPLVRLSLANGTTMELKKGYSAAISPDFTYFVIQGPSGGGTASSAPDTLFSALQWRHYTLRWSRAQGTMDLLVDGGLVRSGKLTLKQSQPAKATMELFGQGRGAFADVQLFDRALTDAQVNDAAGIAHRADFLADQKPPAGGPPVSTVAQERTWVDPASGETLTVSVKGGGPAIYTPENIAHPTITPHTAWAKPLAGRSLSVLLVLKNSYYEADSSLREGVELWQRLGAHIDIANTPSRELFARHYDAIVVSQQGRGKGAQVLGWSSLDPSLRRWILAQVQSGKAGLVLAYPTGLDATLNQWLATLSPADNAPVIRGFPAGATYAHNAPEQFKVYDLGPDYYETEKGLSQAVQCLQKENTRVVKLNYTPGGWAINMGLTPDTPLNSAANDVQYDYWQALLARAILFVAGHGQTARITSISPQGRNWIVTTIGAPAGATLFVRGRGGRGRLYFQSTSPLGRDAALTVPAPSMPPHSAVDAILYDDKGGVLDWYSVAVPPNPDVTIRAVSLDKPSYARGDTLHATATIQSQSPGRYELLAYLTDHEGRRLVRSVSSVDVPQGEGKLSFQLTIPASSDSLLMRVEAQLLRDGRIVATHSADCSVPAASDEGYFSGMSAGPTGNRFLMRYARRWFRNDYGLNLVLRQGKHAYGVPARDNLRYIEYTTTLGLPFTEEKLKDWMEDWNQFFPKHLLADMNEVRPYHPLFYSLGEEHLMGVWSSQLPAVTTRFRAWLEDKYRNLAALNSAWGTQYTDWTQVHMLASTLADMQKIQFDAVRLDNRRFMEHLFADKHAVLADWFHHTIPQSRVGIHTGWDLWMGRGYDYWLLSRAMDCMMTYEGPQLQYARSFFKTSYGNWYHYNLGGIGNVRFSPWVPLLSGAHGVMWYTLAPQRWGAVAADLRLSGDFAASGEEYRQAGRIGQLLSRMNYQDDQVAIHYSQDSFQRGVADLTWVHQAFINLLFDNGVPFKFYSYQQVAEGELLKKHPKLLILPHSISLSDAEARAIRQYVHEGGTLWADVEPGIYSDRGPRLEHPQLVDLFSHLQPQTMEKGPAVQAGSFGKGFVILADLKDYNYQRDIGAAQPYLNLMDWIISKTGIQPVARLRMQDSQQPANGIWTAGYQRGDQKYVAMVKDYHLVDQQPAHVTMNLAAPAYCYSIRDGAYLGHGRQFELELAPTTGQAYALLPYRVRQIEISQPQPAQRGHDLVLMVRLQAEGQIAPQDLHLLQGSVFAPDGSEAVSLRRLVPLSAGSGAVRLPIAYDDAPGRWTVKLRDIATGVEVRHIYSLPPASE